MQQLTERQQQVLDIIVTSLAKAGCPPTLREISDSIGTKGTATAIAHLDALERKGYINRRGGSRGIMLANRPPSSVQVPVVGTVRAGAPESAVEDLQGHCCVDPSWLRGHPVPPAPRARIPAPAAAAREVRRCRERRNRRGDRRWRSDPEAFLPRGRPDPSAAGERCAPADHHHGRRGGDRGCRKASADCQGLRMSSGKGVRIAVLYEPGKRAQPVWFDGSQLRFDNPPEEPRPPKPAQPVEIGLHAPSTAPAPVVPASSVMPSTSSTQSVTTAPDPGPSSTQAAGADK